MALAVAEAHRVLRPGGLLFEIHPVAQPLRLEIWLARGPEPADPADVANHRRVPLGRLAPDDNLEDFAAATQVIGEAPSAGFQPESTVTFEYNYFFDSLDELTDYLEENEELDLAGDDLLESALQGLRQATAPARLALCQDVLATRLRKK